MCHDDLEDEKMMKKIKKLAALTATTLMAGMLCCGCASSDKPAPTAEKSPVIIDEKPEIIEQEANEELTAKPTDTRTEAVPVKEEVPYDGVQMRIGSLKGPTSLGLLDLMEKSDGEESEGQYEFTMATGADEITAAVVRGELDIALVPANVASILYGKTEGGIRVIDINTLGVLYIVSGDESISSMEDLRGKTIYLTGKGTTPDYALRYLFAQCEIPLSEVTLEYKSEATEVAAVLAKDAMAVGLLPQPFATAVCMQNESVDIRVDLTEEWDIVQGETGDRFVTGVTIARKEFVEEHPGAIDLFLKEHASSVEAVNADVSHAAQLAVEKDLIAKVPIGERAIPKCNLVCITGN